jgi:hypothetical protein
MQGRNQDLVGIANGGTLPSVNGDDGDLNQDPGLVSNMVRTTGEVTLRWRNFGAYVRGFAFYDFEQELHDRARTKLSRQALDFVGKDVDLLEHYLSAQFHVGGVPVQFRLGDQVINWGESSLLRFGVDTINPVDLVALIQPATTARLLGRLPYVRSSFASVGQEVGRQYTAVRTEREAVLMEEYLVPEEAASVSVALDRVSVPMEEAGAAKDRAAQPGAGKRKVWRQFRMASCATLTLPDHKGEALQTLRYGRMPQGDGEEWCQTLAQDVCILLRKQPVLGVILLADGAPELWKLLTGSLNADTLGVPVRQLVDLWHLLEKLGSAARLLYGEAQGSAVLQGWRLR